MIRNLLCWLSWHKFSEPEVFSYFEKLKCEHCGKRWVVNTHNQKVWQV